MLADFHGVCVSKEKSEIVQNIHKIFERKAELAVPGEKLAQPQ